MFEFKYTVHPKFYKDGRWQWSEDYYEDYYYEVPQDKVVDALADIHFYSLKKVSITQMTKETANEIKELIRCLIYDSDDIDRYVELNKDELTDYFEREAMAVYNENND